LKNEGRISVDCVVNDPTGRTDRKLDAPEKTFNLNSHVVNQELNDEKVTVGLTGEVVGQESPILSGVSVGPIWPVGVDVLVARLA
jgi:hypothetical protein